jgi:hypothetical protein
MSTVIAFAVLGTMAMGCMFAVNAYRRDFQRSFWGIADAYKAREHTVRHNYALLVVAVLQERAGRRLVQDHDEIRAILDEADERFGHRFHGELN